MTPAPQRRPHLDPGVFYPLAADQDPADALADSEARFGRVSREDMLHSCAEADRPIAKSLIDADFHEAGQVVYSSNAVFLLELDADDSAAPDGRLRAIYKPRRGERPLWDFPRGSLHLREVAAYWLACALGFGPVPVTVLRDGPHGAGSLQRFVHHRDRPLKSDEVARVEAEMPVIAAFDVIANNADRKRAHLLVSRDARLWAIDNALTFLPYPRQRTVLIDLGGDRVPTAVENSLVALAADTERRERLGQSLSLLLSRGEAAATDARIAEFAADPRFPVLDPWEGRPFEWG